MKSVRLVSGLVLGLVNICPGYADTIRGTITTDDQLTLEYVYESSGNSFALNAEPLFQPRITNLSYTTVPKDKCEALRKFFNAGTGELNAESIRMFHPSMPLNLRVQIAKPAKAPEYAVLVQEDLKKQGVVVALPRNETYLNRNSLNLGFRWSDRALSVLGKSDLQEKAQKSLLNTWSIQQDETGIYAVANEPKALASMVCDLQEKNLNFATAYEYQDSFLYFDRGNIQPRVLYSIWQQLSTKSKWIDDIQARSVNINYRDARLIAAGSLLALEIMKSAPNTTLLQPDQFMKTFTTVFNTPTVEVSRFFNQRDADDLADRLGKRIDLIITTIKGNIDL